MIEILALMTAVTLFPLLIYYTVKFAAFAFYRGKFLAEQFNRKEMNHGKPSREGREEDEADQCR